MRQLCHIQYLFHYITRKGIEKGCEASRVGHPQGIPYDLEMGI